MNTRSTKRPTTPSGTLAKPAFRFAVLFTIAFVAAFDFATAQQATTQAEKNTASEKVADGKMTDAQLRDEGFRPLFTGKDLSRWKVEPGHVGHWNVKDGVIHYDGKATQKKSIDKSLWTKESFGETELYIEWCLSAEPKTKQHPIVLWNGDFLRDDKGARITRPHADAGDSGIYFRGHFHCQANIWSQELGSGEINGYRTNKKLPIKLRQSCLPFKNADKPLGQWNTFRVKLAGDAMTVVCNGQLVLQSDPLPDLPATGPIGLQHHGDPLEFRNIWIREL